MRTELGGGLPGNAVLTRKLQLGESCTPSDYRPADGDPPIR
jgi:hypothetical protein